MEEKVYREEVWALDFTLSRWLLPRLRMFKQEVIRIPCYPGRFIKEELGGRNEWEIDEEERKQMSERAFNKWLDIIDEMIEGCEIIANSNGGSLDMLEGDGHQKAKRTYYLIYEYLEFLWV